MSESQAELLEKAVASYQSSMTDEAVEYLESRGIDQWLQMLYRLGQVGEPTGGHPAWLRGWLSIPYLGRGGEPYTVRFRCARDHRCRDHDHGKYMTLAGDLPRLYNVGAIHRAVEADSDEIHIAEGEMDTIVLESLGLHAVGVPGVQTWQPHHRRMLSGFNRIWLWADDDEGGQKLVAELVRTMRNVRVVGLGKGLDVSDALLGRGEDYLMEQLEKAR